MATEVLGVIYGTQSDQPLGEQKDNSLNGESAEIQFEK